MEKIYIFDRQLRIITLDAIERFEISFKTNLAYYFAHEYGAFGYLSKDNLPKMDALNYKKFLSKVSTETRRSKNKEMFVEHFFEKYNEHQNLPVWMLIEIISFGSVLNFYKGIEPTLKRKIADRYKIPYKVLTSWLTAINGVRNFCAHHSRLWNRTLSYKPVLLRINKHPEWHEVYIDNSRFFSILTILKYLMKCIAPQSGWEFRLKDLLLSEKYDVPLYQMGVPDDWRESKLWKDIFISNN